MNATPTRAVVVMPGNAVRMKAQALRDELKPGGRLQSVLQRYTHALFTQVSQSAACIRSHELKLRLARWLVMTHDSASGDQFSMKNEFIAMEVGVCCCIVARGGGMLQNEQ